MLVLVHVAIAAHIAHWMVAGETLTPLEPSEGMEFAKQGIVNAGLVFFALTIVSTLVFGRFFCGWGCHLVALQDAARWLLGKVGIRPRPFRSRILMLVPIAAFYYLFLHPFVQRWARDLGWSYAGTHYTREGFWDTFPPWPVALLTFLVCGFVIVYFLGAKGFCTYACPYGGIFGLVDRWAPGRIRVTDACEGCGHCTATCSSNVLVHKEVRDHGMVVDPGCMKCLDCVSVCPNDALYFGFGKPPARTAKPGGVKPPPRAFSWPEEIALGVLFVLAVLAFRGLFGVVPFLLSLGLAALVAYFAIHAVQLVTKRSVKLQGLALKSGGRLSPAGVVYSVGAAGFLAFWGFAGWLQAHRYAADAGFREVHQLVRELRPRWYAGATPSLADLSADERALCLRTAEHAERLPAWALPRMSHFHVEQAWLALLEGDPAEFERRLDAGLALRPGDPDLTLDRARLLATTGREAEARASLRAALAAAPGFAPARVELSRLRAAAGDLDGAGALLAEGLTLDESSATLHFHLGVVRFVSGRPDLALERFRRAVELDPDYLEARGNLAGALCQTGRFEEGIAELERVVAADPDDVDAYVMLARAHLALQDPAGARARLEAGLVAVPDAAPLHAFLAELCRAAGDERAAEEHRRRARELSAPVAPER